MEKEPENDIIEEEDDIDIDDEFEEEEEELSDNDNISEWNKNGLDYDTTATALAEVLYLSAAEVLNYAVAGGGNNIIYSYNVI